MRSKLLPLVKETDYIYTILEFFTKLTFLSKIFKNYANFVASYFVVDASRRIKMFNSLWGFTKLFVQRTQSYDRTS